MPSPNDNRPENPESRARKGWTAWVGSTAGAAGMTLALLALLPALLHPAPDAARPTVPAVRIDLVRIAPPAAPAVPAAPPEPVQAAASETMPEPAAPAAPRDNQPERDMRPGPAMPAPAALPLAIDADLPGGPIALQIPTATASQALDGAATGNAGLPGFTAAAAEGQLDQPLIALSRLPPIYPPAARQRNLEGAVKIRFVVTCQGTVAQVSVLEARPPGIFDSSVMRCVSAWRFRPATKDGLPVAAWAETTVQFKLK